MSQSHLTIDFPIKGPANAKALTEELPPLMPDFARTQDQLGTVHFSRFMVRGDEKLLFLSDLDGEIETHLARLVENAGPVLDAIFKHVDDAPAMPVADNPQRVITWLKSHVRKPLDTYCAYEASVQDIKACARAAGFTGKTQQSPLLIIMSFKSRLRAVALKLVGEALFHEKGKEALDSVGTVHFSDWVPFENNHMGFFTVYDGDFKPYVQDFADKSTVVFDTRLSTCRWRAADLSSKERPGVLSVGIERTTIRRSGFTAPIQASRFKTLKPCWPTASHNRPPLDSRCGTTINQERRVGTAEQTQGETRMSQSHLTIDFPIKGPANAKALTEELPPLMPDFAKTQDQLGTVHFSRFMVKGDEKLLFLSDIDGEVDKHIDRLVERPARCLTPSSNTWTTLRPRRWLVTLRGSSNG